MDLKDLYTQYKLEVTSLGQGKRLKQLGLQVSTCFYWVTYAHVMKEQTPWLVLATDPSVILDYNLVAPAYSFGTLYKSLPSQLEGRQKFIDQFHDLFLIGYHDLREDDINHLPIIDAAFDATEWYLLRSGDE